MDLYIKPLADHSKTMTFQVEGVQTIPRPISSLPPPPAQPEAHQSLGRRAAHRHLLSSVRRGLSPTGRWHWSGNTGTAWPGLASRRCPGSSLHSPQSCSLWMNREKDSYFLPDFRVQRCVTVDAAGQEHRQVCTSHSPPHTPELPCSHLSVTFTEHWQCADQGVNSQ